MRLSVRSAEPPPLDLGPLPEETRFRVLFVYPNFVHQVGLAPRHLLGPHLGLASLSACVRRIGGRTSLCDLTVVPPELADRVLGRQVRAFGPDLVAVTATSDQWDSAREVVRVCRRLGVAHLVGGPHASAWPEEVIAGADALVVGEGEGAMVDVVRALAGGRPLAGIANVWARTPDGVVRGDRRRLIENLDDLPLPDWQLFQPACYRLPSAWCLPGSAGPLIRARIEGSRGCPYRCTYCTNAAFMDSYRGKGAWRREKSPERMIAELESFRRALGGLGFVAWVDEIFMTGTARLARFCELYRRRIAVPFAIMERPENVTEPKVRMMAEAGLRGIKMGLESGDHRIRVQVLNRHTPEAVLQRAFRLPRRFGVRTGAFNMVGLPGQDEASMLRTWRFIRQVRPDQAEFYVFCPRRGTALYEECVRRGLCDPQISTPDVRLAAVIRHDLLPDRTILCYQRLLNTYATRRGLWPVVAFHLGRLGERVRMILLRLTGPLAAWASSPGGRRSATSRIRIRGRKQALPGG